MFSQNIHVIHSTFNALFTSLMSSIFSLDLKKKKKKLLPLREFPFYCVQFYLPFPCPSSESKLFYSQLTVTALIHLVSPGNSHLGVSPPLWYIQKQYGKSRVLR